MRTSRNIRCAAAAAAALTLAVVPSAAPGQGQKPPKNDAPELTLETRPPTTTAVFGVDVTLTGRVKGTATDRDVLVRLEADETFPYGDAYAATGLTARTSPSGDYTFVVKPSRNTQYRTVSESNPPLTSPGRLILVSPRVTLGLSDATPRRGQRVRFAGTVTPAHDGRRVQIQRRTSTGRFVTIARPRLRDAGTTRSRYVRRIRIRRDGVYRVRIAGHGDHAEAFSPERTVDAHG